MEIFGTLQRDVETSGEGEPELGVSVKLLLKGKGEADHCPGKFCPKWGYSTDVNIGEEERGSQRMQQLLVETDVDTDVTTRTSCYEDSHLESFGYQQHKIDSPAR